MRNTQPVVVTLSESAFTENEIARLSQHAKDGTPLVLVLFGDNTDSPLTERVRRAGVRLAREINPCDPYRFRAALEHAIVSAASEAGELTVIVVNAPCALHRDRAASEILPDCQPCYEGLEPNPLSIFELAQKVGLEEKLGSHSALSDNIEE